MSSLIYLVCYAKKNFRRKIEEIKELPEIYMKHAGRMEI
jgi:hypothetical protein